MATWWITEAVPIPVTALLPLLLLPVFGVAPIAGAAAPYANPIIFLFMGGFIIAMALEACGLHRRMALVIIRGVGTRPVNLIAGFMAATAFLSMWVSNTATVVMMLPMALSVVQMMERQGEPDSTPDPNFALALLLGLAYAANFGGLGTLIGTPPNALLAGFMSEAYGVQIGFGEWMLVGVPLVLVMLPICWLLLTRVLFRIRSEQIAGGDAVIQAEIRSLGSLSRTVPIAGAGAHNRPRPLRRLSHAGLPVVCRCRLLPAGQQHPGSPSARYRNPRPRSHCRVFPLLGCTRKDRLRAVGIVRPEEQ